MIWSAVILGRLCIIVSLIMISIPSMVSFFFLNDPAPTEIYPLPLHAPLPISHPFSGGEHPAQRRISQDQAGAERPPDRAGRAEDFRVRALPRDAPADYRAPCDRTSAVACAGEEIGRAHV